MTKVWFVIIPLKYHSHIKLKQVVNLGCCNLYFSLSCENITRERLERAYKFIRLKRDDDWKPPRNFTVDYLEDSKVLQMLAPQYSHPMVSSAFLYVFGELINKNMII